MIGVCPKRDHQTDICVRLLRLVQCAIRARSWRAKCPLSRIPFGRSSLSKSKPSYLPVILRHHVYYYITGLQTLSIMIIKDVRKEFFDQLKGRILIMCALDVDAICACKILQFLLESFNLQYSVAPVASVDNLWKSFEEYRNSVDSIITINFGNLINLPQLLKPPENLNFFVIDSHRPINVYNYYKNDQVKLYINKVEHDLNIPPKSKIFLKNDSGIGTEDEDEENLALLTADARDLTNEQLEKRRELREWLIQKQKLMFEYEEFHFYNRAVSLIMYDLAIYLSKNNNYLLWLGIVGLTYQLKTEKISASMFEAEAERVVRHISRNRVSSHHARGNSWKIKWQVDLQIDLYRKWTLYDSLWHSQLSVCRFQLWNDKGQRNLLEFLVECGLKLDQCKQTYIAMDLDYKRELLTNVQQVCLGDSQYKYNLQDLISRAFVMSSGFRNTFCANDVVLAARALLESHDPDSTITEKFVRAIQSLSYDEFTLLEQGFDAARVQLKSMFEQVKALITTLKVMDVGVFLHVDLQEHANISKNFARGDSLMSFARFLLNAYVSSKTTRLARRAVRLPLILFCPDYYDQERVLIVGIPPIAQESKKNFFGKAFEQAAANVECEIKADLSETNLVRTSINYKNLLLDQLKLLLE